MTGELFTATHRGRVKVVGQATENELAAITKPVAVEASRDFLERWSLVAIRDADRPGVEIHALGFRPKLRTTWITSPLTGVDMTSRAVATWSGHVYVLGQADDGPDLNPELRAHLGYALKAWGFNDVQD
jgi:hypothetical protein